MSFKTGQILMWYGSLLTIPPNFVLCDGNNGTPNLKDKFLVGAGDIYNVNDSGGNVNHNHSFTSNGHAHYFDAFIPIDDNTGYAGQSNTVQVTGTSNNKDGQPPFKALAYIMKT